MGLTNSNQVALQVQTECEQPQMNSSNHSTKHTRIMAELWVRMEELFPNLWVSVNGLPSLTNGKFETWSRKLSDLTMDDFGKAFANLEQHIEASVQRKEKVYPPSYAEFKGHIKGLAYDAITAQQARQSDSTPLMITKELSAEERSYGNEQSAALRGLFR